MATLAEASSSGSTEPTVPVLMPESIKSLDDLASPMYQVLGSPMISSIANITSENDTPLSQLTEYMINYSQNLNQIGTTVSGLKEFVDVSARTDSQLPSRPWYGFPHQQFIARYLLAYDKLLMYWGTGSGKTGGVIIAAEKLIRDPNSSIDGAVVLASGEMLVKNFQRELLKFTPPGTYDTSSVQNAKSELGRKNVLSREFGTFYTIKTYGDFTGKVIRKYLNAIDSQERVRWLQTYPEDKDKDLTNWPLGQAPWELRGNMELRKQFSNKLFILDEAQNLVSNKPKKLFINPEERYKRKLDRAVQVKGRRGKFGNVTEEQIERRKANPRPLAFEKAEYYILIHRIVHSAHNVKLVLMSADPMIDTADQIIQIANLMAPINEQLAWNVPIINQMDRFRDVMKKYVSHVKSSNVGAKIERIGLTIQSSFRDGDQVINYDKVICTNIMSAFQSKYYYQAIRDIDPDILSRKKILRGKFVDLAHRAIAASNFIFPDGSFGTEGYNKYLKPPRDPSSARDSKTSAPSPAEVLQYRNNYTQHLDLKQRFQACIANPVTLKMMSSKMYDIAMNIRRSFDQPGVVFVYSNLLNHSGMEIMAEVLRSFLKMEEFTHNSSVFIRDQPALDKNGHNRTRNIVNSISYSDPNSSPFRFVLLAGGMSNGRRDSALEILTSDENYTGGLIKVVLSTDVGAIGVSYYHGIQFHALNPKLNYYHIKQAEARILRTNSHDFLRQMTGKSTIEVEIFHHAGVPVNYDENTLQQKFQQDNNMVLAQMNYQFPASAIRFPPPGCDNLDMSIFNNKFLNKLSDIAFYALSNQKEYHIKKIERVLKEIAVDCLINRERNIQSAKTDQENVLHENNYNCYYPPSETISDVNYDNLYSEHEIELIINKMISIFHRASIIQYRALYELLINHKRRFIHAAVDRLISKRIRIHDRNGFPMYLQEDCNSIFLCRDDDHRIRSVVSTDLYSQIPYCNELVGIKTHSLSDIYQSLIQEKERNLLQQLPSLINNENRFVAYFQENFSLTTQIKFYEDLIIGYFYRTSDEVQTSMFIILYNLFQSSTYFLDIPQNTINDYAKERAYPPKQVGRKPNPLNKKIKGKKINLSKKDIPGQMNKTYIHTVWLLDKRVTRYGQDAKLKNVDTNIKILDINQRQWRDVNDYEYPIYNSLITKNVVEAGSSGSTSKNVSSSNGTFDLPANIKFPLYARITPSGQVKIVNKTAERGDGKRDKATGRSIKTITGADLILYFWLLYHGYGTYPGYRIPQAPMADLYQGLSINQMRDEVSNKYPAANDLPENQPRNFEDPNRIQYYYAWTVSKLGSKQQARILQEILEQLCLVEYVK